MKIIITSIMASILATPLLSVSKASQQPVGLTFGLSSFAPARTPGQTPTLFVATTKGADATTTSDDAKTFTLASLTVTYDADGQPQATLLPLAPAASVALDGSVTDSSPLNAKNLQALALLNETFPAVITQDEPAKIYLVIDTLGGTQLVSVGSLKDAAGADVDQAVAGMAGSSKFLFAAVPKAGTTFDGINDDGRGIAVVHNTNFVSPALMQTNADDVTAITDPKAVKIDLMPDGQVVAFVSKAAASPITTATIGAQASLWWDEHLERLFVGLNNVQRDATTNEGGVLGVFMGYVDENNAFVLKPIVAGTPNTLKNLFYGASDKDKKNVKDRMIGFYFDGVTKKKDSTGTVQAKNNGDDDISVSINQVQTMYTSTGKSYLIVHSTIANNPVVVGGVIVAQAEDWLYALPLVDTELNNKPANKGTIAKIDSTKKNGLPALTTSGALQLPTVYDDMPVDTYDAMNIGKGSPIPGTYVSDFSVVGDQVFLALSGFDGAFQGVFSSTAIFSANGFIRSWTPARRVMGSVQKVFQLGVDARSASDFFIGNHVNVGQITQWGVGDQALHGNDEATLLSSVLDELFEQETGGVQQLYTFDQQTPGFEQDAFAMMVAVGKDRVALIEAGRDQAGTFTPTAAFISGVNVFLYNDDVLKSLAPLTSAAVVRDDTNKKGYVYVSGLGGVAKTVQWWDTTAFNKGLSQLTTTQFPGATPLQFQKLGTPVTDTVLKVSSFADKLYLLELNKLVQTGLDGAPSKTANISVGADLLVLNNDEAKHADPAVLVASAAGVQVFDKNLILTSSANIAGQAFQFVPLAQRDDQNAASVPANVYALTFGNRVRESEPVDQAVEGQAVQVYRLAVEAGPTVKVLDQRDVDGSGKKVDVPFVQYDTDRFVMGVDGTTLFNAQPRSVTDTDFVRTIPLAPVNATTLSNGLLAENQSLTDSLALDQQINFNVAPLVRDPASGAWVIPGDWGVRVNE